MAKVKVRKPKKVAGLFGRLGKRGSSFLKGARSRGASVLKSGRKFGGKAGKLAFAHKSKLGLAAAGAGAIGAGVHMYRRRHRR